jgi:hypothetical protein
MIPYFLPSKFLKSAFAYSAGSGMKGFLLKLSSYFCCEKPLCDTPMKNRMEKQAA